MNLAGTQFTLKDRAFEIYLSGCTIHCKGCHNPELWDFNYGDKITDEVFSSLVEKIKDGGKLINEIRILGGEPLDHQVNLHLFVSILKSRFPDKLFVLFTGYDYINIPIVFFSDFDGIKYGKYDETKRVEGEELASSNQRWWRK